MLQIKITKLFSILILISVGCSENNPEPNISVSPNNIELSGFATQIDITINSNTRWTLSSNESWISYDLESGSGTHVIRVNVADNPETVIRSSFIKVANDSELPTITINITQLPKVEIVAGGNGPGPNLRQLFEPAGICLDVSRNLYVVDQLNQRVVRWSPGSAIGINVAGGNGAGEELYQFNNPYGIFVKEDGIIYVSDLGNNRITKWQPASNTGIIVAGGNGSGNNLNQLNGPNGLHVDINDTIYISEGANSRISKWASGDMTGKLVAQTILTDLPNSMFRDANGDIYVVSGDYVAKFEAGTNAGSIVAGNNGFGDDLNQLNDPTGIYVTANGDLYISDQGNNRILKWPLEANQGIVVAGGNGKGSRIDQLDYPIGIWLDEEGNIYISDRGNHRVVKWYK